MIELLRQMSNKYAKISMILCGIMTVSLFYLSWCFSTISYKGTLYCILHLATAVLCMFSYILMINRIKKYDLAIGQFSVCNLVLLLVYLVVVVNDIRSFDKYGIPFLLTDLCWILTSIYVIRILKIPQPSVQGVFHSNKVLIVSLIVLAFVALEPFKIVFAYDGELYRQAFEVMDIHSLSSLGAYGHLSQGYATVVTWVNIIVGDISVSLWLCNLLLYLGSVIGFYLLIREVTNEEKSKLFYIVVTMMYGVSPYLLGMEGYYSVDYAMTCLFVWVILTLILKKWLAHMVLAALFCFTKEPAIVAYGCLCLGAVIANVIRDKRSVFAHLEYYLMLMVGLFWLVTYSLIGGWSGGKGEFVIDIQYVIDKLKVLYVLNFSWLIVFGIITFIIVILAYGKKNITDNARVCLIIVSASMIGFTIFGITYNTVNHARYTAIVPVALYILFATLLSFVSKKIICVVFSGIVALLLLCSCYRTIDPVSLRIFDNMHISDSVMITTGNKSAGDSMIYNKQMLFYQIDVDESEKRFD